MTPYERGRELADTFLDEIDTFWAEHGIDEDEAFLGVVAVLQGAGVFSPTEADEARQGLRDAQNAILAEAARKRQERFDALTPEQQERKRKSAEFSRKMMRVQTREFEKIFLGQIGATPFLAKPTAEEGD